MDFSLSERQSSFRDRVRVFGDAEIRPRIHDAETGISRSQVRRYRQAAS